MTDLSIKHPSRMSEKDEDFLLEVFEKEFRLNPSEAYSELAGCYVAKFEHYISDGPGFVGTVYVIVHGGGPEYLTSVARGYDGKVIVNSSGG